MDYRAEMETAIARFDQFSERHESRDLGSLTSRGRKRGTAARSQRIATLLLAVALLAAVAVGASLALEAIGSILLFVGAALLLALILAIGFRPSPSVRPIGPYQETMPNKAVVKRLGAMLARHRGQLPTGASQRVGAIEAQLPMIESQLSELNPLDPLAQDARRLMGEHLPELIERYQRVPAQYRRERDGEGMSVDERLVAGLDAAREAIDDLGRRLSRQELDAFETQGRFIESRYRPGELGTES